MFWTVVFNTRCRRSHCEVLKDRYSKNSQTCYAIKWRYLKKSILLNVAGFTAVTLLKMKPLSIDFLLSLLILCNEFYHQKVLWLPHWFTSIKIVIGKIINTTITCNFLNIFPNSNYISLLRIFLSALFYSN